jgi:hypothetical protein
MRADRIIELLAAKHAEDVFVPECKDGPTQSGEHLRMDAWVMKKSWSKPLTIVYEVKVSRSDFLSDDKWKFYLPYCNEFYFVCPAGLIKPEELPPEAGLLYVSTTETMLFKKKKSSYRADVAIPEAVSRYILMSRVKVQREYEKRDNVVFWRGWLTEVEKKQKLGYEVSRKVRDLVEKYKDRAETAERRVKDCAEIENRISELGFDPKRRIDTWGIKNKLAELNGGMPKEFMPSLRQVKNHAEKLIELLARDDA